MLAISAWAESEVRDVGVSDGACEYVLNRVDSRLEVTWEALINVGEEMEISRFGSQGTYAGCHDWAR